MVVEPLFEQPVVQLAGDIRWIKGGSYVSIDRDDFAALLDSPHNTKDYRLYRDNLIAKGILIRVPEEKVNVTVYHRDGIDTRL